MQRNPGFFKLLLIPLGLFLFCIELFAIDKECLRWFQQKVEVTNKETCERNCAVAKRDMGSFSCTECKDYCEIAFRLEEVEKPEIYTPLLNTTELSLAAKHPSAVWKVYESKSFAEEAAKEKFGFNDEGDESDALRHFAWASRITRDLGSNLAEEFLDAHEAGGDFNSDSTAMDLANNRAGILFSLKAGANLTDSQIISEALKRIQENKLVMTRRRPK